MNAQEIEQERLRSLRRCEIAQQVIMEYRGDRPENVAVPAVDGSPDKKKETAMNAFFTYPCPAWIVGLLWLALLALWRREPK